MNNIPTDINFMIFKYLNFEDLIQLYKTNKLFNRDMEKYCNYTYKRSFSKVLYDKLCIHCNNICSNEKFKVCDNCTCDTCWNCFTKIGSDKMILSYKYDKNIMSFCPYYLCIDYCNYQCKKCKRNYTNKNDVIIKNCRVVCLACTF